MISGFVVSVNSASPTLIHTAAGRTKVRVRNGNPADVYFGDASVASLNGWLTWYQSGVPETSLLDVTLNDGESLYGISTSGTWAINVLVQN